MGCIYVWDEIDEVRSSQEIIVVRHLREKTSKHKKNVLYCDACGG